MDISKLKLLIGAGRIDNVLEIVFKTLTNFEKFTSEIISLKGRYQNNEKKKNQEIISYEQYRLTKSIITKSLLDLLNELEDIYRADDQLTPPSINENNQLKRLIIQLSGTYQIEQDVFADGNSATLYKAKDIFADKSVIIKVLKNYNIHQHTNGKYKGSKSEEERLKREVQATKKLKHRNVIKLYWSQIDEIPQYAILEFIDGKDLQKIIASSGKRPLHESKRLLIKILDGLRYLHKHGIYPIALKPDKILIDYEREPILSPFIIFRQSYNARTLSQMKKDFMYLSPEQIEKEGFSGNKERNLFSFGLLAYFIITGEHLFSGKKLMEIIDDRKAFFKNASVKKRKFEKLQDASNEEMVAIIQKLLHEDPKDRDISLSKLLQQIDDALSGDYHFKILKESYERCRFNFDKKQPFLERFYEEFLNKSKEANNRFTQIYMMQQQSNNAISLDEENQDDILKRQKANMIKRQAKKLHHAINMIIESTKDQHYLHNIHNIGKGNHKNLTTTDYNVFLDTLHATIKEYDRSQWSNCGDIWEKKFKEIKEILKNK